MADGSSIIVGSSIYSFSGSFRNSLRPIQRLDLTLYDTIEQIALIGYQAEDFDIPILFKTDIDTCAPDH
jgi:hypothetical protein